MRKYGLACDNVQSVKIITADGQIRTANESENADLFWGVRGGGGNFGVVTSLEYSFIRSGKCWRALSSCRCRRQGAGSGSTGISWPMRRMK